jgi:hypothetical protein
MLGASIQAKEINTQDVAKQKIEFLLGVTLGVKTF